MPKISISTSNLFSICLIVFALQILAFGQIRDSSRVKSIIKDIVQYKSQYKLGVIPPKLILRYERGSGLGGFIKDMLSPRQSGLLTGKEKIAIRICSREKLLLALPTATQNPFYMTDFLINNAGFKPSNIKLLRSEDCIPSANPNLYATELWTLGDDSSLIPNVEQYDYEQIKTQSLGFDPLECPKVDYKKATKQLIENMRNDSNSYGVIVKYFFEKPTSPLNKRTENVEKLLRKSGIPNYRYKITSQSWNEGESPCYGKEPNQPVIIFITAISGKQSSGADRRHSKLELSQTVKSHLDFRLSIRFGGQSRQRAEG